MQLSSPTSYMYIRVASYLRALSPVLLWVPSSGVLGGVVVVHWWSGSLQCLAQALSWIRIALKPSSQLVLRLHYVFHVCWSVHPHLSRAQ